MKKFFLLSLLFAVLVSCKKDPFIPEANTTLPGIAGNWKLIAISGGWGGSTLPKQNLDLNLKLSGLYYSDILNFKSEGTYQINYDPNMPTIYHESAYKISFDANLFQYFVQLKNDSLSLFFAGNDGDDYVFVRQ